MLTKAYNLPTMAVSSGFVAVPAFVEGRKVFIIEGTAAGTMCTFFNKIIITLKCIQDGIVRFLVLLAIWATSYAIFGDTALPGGSLFAITILVPCAIFLGHIIEKIHLPPLVGMLLAGLILSNVPYINVAKNLSISLSSPLRGISVVILLTRGALSTSPTTIRKHLTVVPALAIGCCVTEAITASLAVYFIIGFPLQWSFLMGCIMSAMSQACVMPYLTKIEKNKKICPDFCTSIVIAKTACGLDAILGICMAEVALGFIYSQGNVGIGFMKGPLEVLVGGAFATLWGTLAGVLLSHKIYSDRLRTIVTLCGGIMSLLGLYRIGYGRGGPLGTFLGALIASSFWRSNGDNGNNNEQISKNFTDLWYIFQPLLFGIIGTRIDFSTVDWNIVSLGIACLLISLTVRTVAAFLFCSFGSLSIRERLFISLAWIPKGTVQAALGPVALDTVRDLALGQDFEIMAYKVMNIAVTTIVIGSVLGGIMLTFVAPKVLTVSNRENR